MIDTSRLRALPGVLCLCLLAAACGEPPAREMSEAQGALEAARAAGAERYAAEEFQAAATALDGAHEAAAQRDYRLALNHALDSRERAQNAARQAAEGRAQAQSQAERMLADVTAALAEAARRVTEAEAARVPRKELAVAQETIAGVQGAVQEAGTALGEEDFPRAQEVLMGRAEAVRAASARLAELTAAQARRPARRSR